jgi:hypothetical protein
LNQIPGPVTMDTNTINSTGCSSYGLSSSGFSFDHAGNVVGPEGNVVAAVPEPSAFLLLGSVIAVLAAQRRWARAKSDQNPRPDGIAL